MKLGTIYFVKEITRVQQVRPGGEYTQKGDVGKELEIAGKGVFGLWYMENSVQKQNQPLHIYPKLGVNKGPRVPRESLMAGKVGSYFAGREKAADMTQSKRWKP